MRVPLRGRQVPRSIHRTDPGLAERALELGFQSLAAFPIVKNGAVVGVFVLYSADRDFFDEEDTGFRATAIYAMGRSLQARFLPTILNETSSDETLKSSELMVPVPNSGDRSQPPRKAPTSSSPSPTTVCTSRSGGSGTNHEL